MKTANITILSDNQAGKNLSAEHGLSIWIEIGSKRILFDTGQGATFDNNARALGINLAKTDMLVLSHGHYDHTGGIPYVLQQAGNVHVYCHPGVVTPRYRIRNGTPTAIHMPPRSLTGINKLATEQLHWVQQPLYLSDTIGLTGPIPRESIYENTGGPFYLDPGGYRSDPIDDDMALWIRTPKGLIVLVGCCHSGLINTLNHVQHLNDGMKIRTVIGGFHLMTADFQRINKTITALRFLNFDQLIPCHCTGHFAVSMLHGAFGKQVLPGAVGNTFLIEF